MREGIGVAGNIVEDIIFSLDYFPAPGQLSPIRDDIVRSVGGSVCNVGIDLARLDPDMPVQGLGMVGEDENGRFVLSKLNAVPNLCTDGILREGNTCFTHVMSDESTKQRTFFYYAGANAKFAPEHIDWDKLNVSILHVAYIMLLPALDAKDEEYGTKMARLLAKAQSLGIETSIDVVSDVHAPYGEYMPPALKYTDYCVINELEAQMTTNVELRSEDGTLRPENMKRALEILRGFGVKKWAVIHAPEGAFGMNCADGEYMQAPSLKLPKDYIGGTVGAGDAFCAGVLYAGYKKQTLDEAMRWGNASAAASLSGSDGTSGMRPMADALKLYDRFGVR